MKTSSEHRLEMAELHDTCAGSATAWRCSCGDARIVLGSWPKLFETFLAHVSVFPSEGKADDAPVPDGQARDTSKPSELHGHSLRLRSVMLMSGSVAIPVRRTCDWCDCPHSAIYECIDCGIKLCGWHAARQMQAIPAIREA